MVKLNEAARPPYQGSGKTPLGAYWRSPERQVPDLVGGFSWGLGSYLNVGAHFLWRETNHITFDFGYRKEGFVEFVDEEQFAPEAESLARRAADEVGLLRSKLHSPLVIHSMTPKNTGEEWIDRFHRGVSLGLAGRADDAAFVLGSANEESALLIPLLADAAAFEAKVVEQIKARREALNFPALNESLWNLEATKRT